MTTAKQLIEQGRAEGLIEGEARGEAKGEAKGEARGRAATLLKLLSTHRASLGPLSAADLERVHGASIAALDLWIERLFTATSRDELFGP